MIFQIQAVPVAIAITTSRPQASSSCGEKSRPQPKCHLRPPRHVCQTTPIFCPLVQDLERKKDPAVILRTAKVLLEKMFKTMLGNQGEMRSTPSKPFKTTSQPKEKPKCYSKTVVNVRQSLLSSLQLHKVLCGSIKAIRSSVEDSAERGPVHRAHGMEFLQTASPEHILVVHVLVRVPGRICCGRNNEIVRSLA